MLSGAWPLRAEEAVDARGQALARGDAAFARREPEEALAYYEQALAVSPNDPIVLRDTATAALTIAQLGDGKRPEPIERGLACAQRYVDARPGEAEGYFLLAWAYGQQALSGGPLEQIRLSQQVHAAASRALELDPEHDGALHVLGEWHAALMRVPGPARFLAGTFLGAKVYREASWEKATAFLERAAAVRPDSIAHHVALGRVYRDTGRRADAIAQWRRALELEPVFAGDPRELEAARAELAAAGR